MAAVLSRRGAWLRFVFLPGAEILMNGASRPWSCRLPCLLAVVLLGAPGVFGQTLLLERPLSIEPGAFGIVDDSLRKLMRLHLEGNQIRLDRNWERRLGDIRSGNPHQATIDQMIARGDDPEMIERMRRHAADWAERRAADPPVVMAFNAVATSFPRAASRGHSGGSDGLNAHFEAADMLGSLRVSGDSIRLAFQETAAAGRELRLSDDAAGEFTLTVNSHDLLVDFRQQSSGECRLIVINEEVSVFRAADFAAFVEQHPAAVDGCLVPVLKAFGIGPPLLKSAPEVQAIVLALLEGERGETDERFEQLVADLDAASFETRTQATELLANEFPLWQERIQNRLLDRDSLSPEAIKRLRDILEAHAEKQDLFEFVERQNLTGSAGYLVWLLELSAAEHRPAVVEKLQRLTGQTLGDDPAGWKKWLADSGSGNRP